MHIRVEDVMSRYPITVSPDDSLREIAEVLSVHNISGAPVVVDDDLVVGVISASDLIDFAAMSPGVPTAAGCVAGSGDDDQPREERADPQTSAYFLDLWADPGAEALAPMQTGREWNTLEEHTAGELMTRVLVSVTPETTAREAARTMLATGVHRLLVLRDGQLRGVVTSTDLLRVLAGGGPD